MKLTLGEECLILRRRAKLKLSEAAKALKITAMYLSLIEHGTRNPEKALIYRDYLRSKNVDISP